MEQAMNILSLVWPFLILVAIMYFFMYRPTKKMKLERGRFLLSLKKGDKVVTSGGVHGTIKVLRDKYVELEIAPKVIVKVEKSAIQHFEGKPAVGEAPVEEVIPQDKKSKKDEPETQVVEEVVEVDDPKDAGTEVIEEEVEVDDKEEAPKADKSKNEAKK
ncbi:preprotein translocase subunit YajC [uncultured Dialister sp.]|uniref:preprotein translocase subunit YajC n=1 Tax=uncultured Dialister sp. TaxID=278064 RepID=UPI0025DBADF7|nr:preprotein translocase subunit YajC [uncultured Dialister sp.]